jgi:DNA-binding transcriptional LysR family regulator
MLAGKGSDSICRMRSSTVGTGIAMIRSRLDTLALSAGRSCLARLRCRGLYGRHHHHVQYRLLSFVQLEVMGKGEPLLNVRYLAVFRAVVKTGSISAAARVLHVSQPAVTKSVRLLESEIGLSLFFRANGRLQLTPEAEALMPEVERLFGNVQAIQDLAEEIRDGFSGSISIATVTTLSTTLVGDAVARFHQQYKGLRFDIRSMNTRNVIDAVARHQVDIGVVDVAPTGVDLEAIELCRVEVGCIVRHDHPLAARRQLKPADLAPHPLIGFSEETYTGRHLRNAFEDSGTPFHVSFTVNHTRTAYTLVQAGTGVAFVDAFPKLAGSFPDLCIVRFRPLIETRAHVVFSRTRAVPLMARNFVKALQDQADALASRAKAPVRVRSSRAVGASS